MNVDYPGGEGKKPWTLADLHIMSLQADNSVYSFTFIIFVWFYFTVMSDSNCCSCGFCNLLKYLPTRMCCWSALSMGVLGG